VFCYRSVDCVLQTVQENGAHHTSRPAQHLHGSNNSLVFVPALDHSHVLLSRSCKPQAHVAVVLCCLPACLSLCVPLMYTAWWSVAQGAHDASAGPQGPHS
jgi:hypothetical protein